MAEHSLPVQGMTCDGCVRTVTKVLEAAGVEVVEVTLTPGRAVVRTDKSRAEVAEAIEDAGFDVPAA